MTPMVRMRHAWSAVSVVLLFALTLGAGAVRGQDASPAASPASVEERLNQFGPVEASEEYRIAFMQPYPNLTFWQILQAALEERAAAAGVEVDVIALSSGDVSEQVSQMEDAVTQGYDGIILGTIDAAGIVPGIEAANEADIPVLAVDTAPAGGELVSLVQTDNVAAAGVAGAFIAEQIDGSGKVLNLQGDLANQTGQARSEGVEAALAEFPEIEVISQTTNWQQDQAVAVTENVLTSDPEIAAIFAASDDPALGALQVIEEAGRDDIVLVGFDANPEAVQAVASGRFAGEIAQFPAVMGAVGVDLLVRHLNGEEVPELVDSGSALITQENVDQFLGAATPEA